MGRVGSVGRIGIAKRVGAHDLCLRFCSTSLQFARTWLRVNQCPQNPECYRGVSTGSIQQSLRSVASLLLAVVLVFVSATASAKPLRAPADWQSVHYQDHVLVGTVWRANGEPSSWEALAEAVTQAPLILVGEVHPNPDHHRLQAAVLAAVVASGQRPAVVWEMIPSARQPQLDEWTAAPLPDALALGETLDWRNSGWPAWSLYEPIAQIAAAKRLKMIGTALPRETMMNIGRKGADGLADNLKASLHLNVTLNKQAQAGLMKSLRDGHCDLMPESALAPMSVAQRARDGAMADAMLRAIDGGSSVLVAGNGHVRQDWGVGGLLSKLSPGTQSLSIAQIEVQAEQTDPHAYFEQQDAANGYDFIIFTPKAEIKDYCAELRKRFGKKK